MRNIKKLALVFACLAMLTVTVCQVASALENSAHASLYLSNYAALLSPGGPSGTGKLDINFDVTATDYSDKVGASKIEIYRSDGTRVVTITGTVSNGLLREDALGMAASHSYYGVSGKTYYAVLTMYAERDGGSDSKLYTTDRATAP